MNSRTTIPQSSALTITPRGHHTLLHSRWFPACYFRQRTFSNLQGFLLRCGTKWYKWLTNLQEWVQVSLGAPFIWPCATSKQKTTRLQNVFRRKQQARNIHVYKNKIKKFFKKYKSLNGNISDIGLMVRVETWVQSQVESYQRLKKGT